MTDTILRAEHLTKNFPSGKGEFTAVHDVNFEIKRGECLGIVGESGSGKTTVARMVTGLLAPTSGRIFLMGRELTGASGGELRAAYRNMQMIFQMPAESFNPRYTLGDGIGESLRNAGVGKKQTKARVAELLEQCGLSGEFASRYPHQASGGECQRAAIARALAIDPELLICDEATSALDVTVQKQILELLLRLKEEKKRSFLFISHDLAIVQSFCERVLVLYQGQVVEYGDTDRVISHPESDYTKKMIASVLQ